MRTNTFWNQRLAMLMACASPGSAFAYHLGLLNNRSRVLRRDTATADSVAKDAGQIAHTNSSVEELLASGRVTALP
jgi:hypothetical protein